MSKREGHAPDERRFRPYPKCKDSGLAWPIPAHWRVDRLKNVADVRFSNVDKHSVDGQKAVRLCNYVDVYYNDRITSTIEFMRATATSEQIERFGLLCGDVLVTKDSESWTDIAVPACVSEDLPGVLCGYHLALIRPNPSKLHGPFLARALSAVGPRDQFQVAANGITRFGLSTDSVTSATFAIPPLNEQRAVASFLDREIAKIDALVAKRERLIELLEQKRAALITRAVTQGLNVGVPLKSSGVEWLGKIPAHWRTHRIKEISPRLNVGVVVNPSSYVSNEGLPFLYGSDIGEGRITPETARRITPEASRRLPQSQLHAGDLVTVRVGAPGTTAVVPPALEGANCASVLLIRRSPAFDSDWLCYVMNSRVVRYQVEQVQYGAAQEQFNVSHAINFSVPFPPLSEQQEMSAFLNRETKRLVDLIAAVRAGIDRLAELRAALISAAVTGQIDVREEVA